MIPQSFIQLLLDRADIVSLIGREVQLKKAGANFLGRCPFHQEKSPSFTVSPAKQFFHCFGCGAHGTAITYLMRRQNLGFIEAVEALAEFQGMEVPKIAGRQAPQENYTSLYDALEMAASFFEGALAKNPEALAYLDKRATSEETKKRFRLGYAPGHSPYSSIALQKALPSVSQEILVKVGLLIKRDNGTLSERFRDRLIVPIIDRRNRVIGFGGRTMGADEPKYLNSPETEVFHKGREWFGLPQAMESIRKTDSVIVVEGYFDAMALSQAGINQVVASMGTAMTPEQITVLFHQCSRIILCFDGDLAGMKAAWRAIERILPVLQDGKMVEIVTLPDGMDPDDLVKTRGKEEAMHLINNGKRLSEVLVASLREDYDGSSETKAMIVRKSAPWISALSPHLAPIFRNDLIQKISTLVELPLEMVVRGLPSAKLPSAPIKRFSAQKVSPSAERWMLLEALEHPDAIHHILAGVINPDSAYSKALQWIADRWDAGEWPQSWASRVELLSREGFESLVAELMVSQMREEAGARKAEELSVDLDFRRKHSEVRSSNSQMLSRYHTLCQKMTAGGLTDEEKAELRTLIPQMQGLQKVAE